MNYKESRPRNLGRGVSKPKKNTVASLLAQSRAVGLKPLLSTQQLLSQGADLVRRILHCALKIWNDVASNIELVNCFDVGKNSASDS